MKESAKAVAALIVAAALLAMGYGAYRVLSSDDGTGGDAGDGETPTGSAVYSMAYTDENGNARTLSAFKGKWLVVDLTGTTCVYCPDQYAELKEVRASEPASSVAILSVEVWGATVAEMAQTASDEGLLWDWGVDRGGAFATEWGTTVPRVVVIDPQGNVARVFSPGIVQSEDIKAVVGA